MAEVFFFLIFITGLVFLVRRQERLRQEDIRKKLQALYDAEDLYKNSLEALKNNPTDANRKQKCLQFGRELASLTRNYQGIEGVTIFDELALMNDINAACAGAPSLSTKNRNFSNS